MGIKRLSGPVGIMPAPDAANSPHVASEALLRGVEGVRAAAPLRVGPEAVQAVQVGVGWADGDGHGREQRAARELHGLGAVGRSRTWSSR